ncbi:hypothetical protein JOE23_000040 [Amphibacillus cookii]|nr:hypothetical protein [Amphibacillus cookii]
MRNIKTKHASFPCHSSEVNPMKRLNAERLRDGMEERVNNNRYYQGNYFRLFCDFKRCYDPFKNDIDVFTLSMPLSDFCLSAISIIIGITLVPPSHYEPFA